MSRAAVEQVIGKLLTDTQFRAAVAADPAAALAGYDLTAEEREAFTRIESADVEEAASALDARFSKGATISCGGAIGGIQKGCMLG